MIITSSELRLGNLLYNIHGEIHEVRENTFQLFRYPTMNGDPSGLRGIPLTPEILEKAGFEEYDGNEWYRFYRKSEVQILIHREVDSVFAMFNQVKIESSINNLRLHQLQNLYFALTGEELQIDL